MNSSSKLLAGLALGLVTIVSVIVSCAKDEVFPPIGNKIVSPTDVAVSKDGETFYILNSDMDRTYNKGTILMMDTDGNKLSTIETPRMGRMMVVSEDVMAVGYASPGDEGTTNSFELYDISNPRSPALKKTFKLDCNPLNTVMRTDYDYFAISCQSGVFYIGKLDRSNLAATTISKVRTLGATKRALFIDPANEVLYAFPTDTGILDYLDIQYEDVASWDDDFKKTDEPNEIPDSFEISRASRVKSRAGTRHFQLFLYDIKEGRENNFPYIEYDDMDHDKELRWIYFDEPKADDAKEDDSDDGKKYYRTNFYEARPDPKSTSSFYLSHRGVGASNSSPHANQIVKVTINSSPFASEGEQPKTADFLGFESVYSVQKSLKDGDIPAYVSDFEIGTLDGEQAFFTNTFRDLANFKRNGGHGFAVSAAIVGENAWNTRVATTSPTTSYFQLAIGAGGKILAGSFYGNRVMLLEVTSRTDIKEPKQID